MVKCLEPQERTSFASKSEQFSYNTVQNAPDTSILLVSLKVFENELTSRDLVEGSCSSPLWFIAETERNVYLWRHGYSLDDADEFEFWVDIPALIQKRVDQLSRYSGANPFINPVWGLEVVDDEDIESDIAYLTALQDALPKILPHANALSRVNSEIYRELTGQGDDLEIVVLPSGK